MSMSTTRKAIQEATLDVQTYVKDHGSQAAARKDWSNAPIPTSIPDAEREQYRETYELAAKHAAALVASFN